jgi:HK97 family phage major capsid protein
MPQAETTTPEDNAKPSWQERKRINEERNQTLADMQAMLKDAEADKGRDLTDEENAKFDKLNTRSEQLATQIERWDKLVEASGRIIDKYLPDEQRSQQPGQHDIIPGETEERDDQGKLERRAFTSYLRHGMPQDPDERRSLTIGGMGVVGIRPFSSEIFDKMKSFAGVREAGADIIPTSDGNPMTWGIADDTANEGRLVGEAVTNSNATDPAQDTVELGAFKFSSDWIKVSYEMVQDAAFDVEAYVARKATERIGRAFNRYSTTGTGTGQPQGVTSAAAVGKVAAATNAIVYDELLDLIHDVDAAYRSLPSFTLMLHDSTLAALRKLKDGNGAYIWSAGAAGAPNQILGYLYVVNNHLAELSAGANAKVLLAGAFEKYLVRDVTTPIVLRDISRFADDGLIGFKVDSRHDGRLGDNTAIKALALAAA